MLERHDQDQNADTPAAVALRAHLAHEGPDIDFLPDDGWTLAGLDADGAEFVTVGGESGMKVVTLESGPDAWRVTGWGDCQARRSLPDGLGDADWRLAPDQPKLGPGTMSFVALVTERACASGRSSEGRVVGPDVVVVDHDILVTFAVRPQGGEIQECPGNPSTRVVVDLGEPLGDRTLLDGATLPPRDPTTAP